MQIDDGRTLVIPSKYTPRKWQKWCHAKMRRFNVLNVHRRGGKSHLAIAELKDRSLRNTLHMPQYVYLGPTYQQVKKIAWTIMKEYFGDIPGIIFKEGELKVEIPRPEYGDHISIWLVSAENPDGLRGLYLDGVILDEFSDFNPVIWSLTLRPALSDRKGWGIFLSTPRGQDHFFDMYNIAKEQMQTNGDWFAATLTVEDTGAIHADELDDLKATMTEDEIAQEFYCSFNAALTGAVFSDLVIKAEESGRVCDLPYDSAYGVNLYWDLGVRDSTAIWFVQKPLGSQYYHVIDYYECNGKGVPHYLLEIQKKGYFINFYVLPHDAKQREFTTGTSRLDGFTKRGIRNYDIVPKVGAKVDAIHAVREILPLCKFDKKKTEGGLAALRNYQREWDAKHKIFKDSFKHDWTSHGSDAFQTFARGIRPEHFIGSDTYNKSLPTTAILEYTEY